MRIFNSIILATLIPMFDGSIRGHVGDDDAEAFRAYSKCMNDCQGRKAKRISGGGKAASFFGEDVSCETECTERNP